MLKLPIFRNPALFRQAMTHRSYANEHPEQGDHNERLEFLGDAVLTYLAGEFLYRRYPDKSEGELTPLRAALVDEAQLAKFAEALQLSQQLYLGKGTAMNGGRQNPNLLSSAFESLIGAYLLDTQSDVEAVRRYVEPLLASVVDQLVVSVSTGNVKSRFQEWALAHLGENPTYAIINEVGPDHAKTFTATVNVQGKCFGVGTGKRKQDAEKQAAADALQKLGLAPR